MLRVEFRTIAINPTSVKVAWDILNYEEITNIKSDKPNLIKGFNILFCESPSGPFVRVNSELITESFYKHISFNYSKFKNYYYILEAEFHDGKKEKSGTLTIYPQQLKAMRTILNVHVFDTMSGVSQIKNTPVIFYQSRTSGQACSRCVINKNIGSIASGCPVCDGTGYEGGYYNPILAWVDYKQAFSLSKNESNIMTEENSTQLITTSAFFLVPKPGDYFREIFPPNRLYSVVQILQRSEDSNKPISVTFSVQEELSQHPLFKKEIPQIEFPDKFYYNKIFTSYEEYSNIFREKTT